MNPLYRIVFLFILFAGRLQAQVPDTVHHPHPDSLHILPANINYDSTLRITNINPYITLHVDSTLSYKLDINKDVHNYYWFLRNAPVGLKINKDNGTLGFKAEKSYFLSGRLKYDTEYKVSIGVQNLANPKERVDTFFTLLFYSTEITASRVKPTVSNTLYIEEGDTVSFKVQCEEGSFPIESVATLTSVTIKNYTPVTKCDEVFNWPIPFDFIKDTDKDKERLMTVTFVGINKFFNKDTSVIRIYVRDALNYPERLKEYRRVSREVNYYILQLKYAFRELDKRVKKTKGTRSGFDLATGTTALGGTVFSSMSGESQKTAGKILPGVGVALVPVKETVSPNKTNEQNSASVIRISIRRLEFNLTNNSLQGDIDPEIVNKTRLLKDELKSAQTTLIEVPLDTGELSEEELNKYFNNPKVNKKYKMKK